jgi:hypothetical protein
VYPAVIPRSTKSAQNPFSNSYGLDCEHSLKPQQLELLVFVSNPKIISEKPKARPFAMKSQWPEPNAFDFELRRAIIRLRT